MINRVEVYLTIHYQLMALVICDKFAVITGRRNGKAYQTSSLENKMTTEDLNEFIKTL